MLFPDDSDGIIPGPFSLFPRVVDVKPPCRMGLTFRQCLPTWKTNRSGAQVKGKRWERSGQAGLQPWEEGPALHRWLGLFALSPAAGKVRFGTEARVSPWGEGTRSRLLG